MKQLLQNKIVCNRVTGMMLTLAFLLFSGTVFGQEIVATKTADYSSVNCNQFDVTIEVTGNPTEKAQEVVLIIDRSGSMDDGPFPEPIDFAQDAAIEFVNNFFLPQNNPTGNNRLALVTFGSSASLDYGLSGSSNRANIINAINNIFVSGATNTQAALQVADQELTNNGTFNCDTSRSIILLTDGLPTRCSGGFNTSTCIPAAITAAQNAQTTTIGGDVYEQNIFSIGLVGALNSSETTIATNFLDAVQNSGLFITANNANIQGIYDTILGQLIPAASQLPGQALISDTIAAGLSVVPNSISINKGTIDVNNQLISWFVDDIFDETITLTYTVSVTDPNLCGDQLIGTTVMNYENSDCNVSSFNFDDALVCVPCPSITPTISRVDCTNAINYDSNISQSGACNPNSNSYAWEFTLNGNVIGTSNASSGVFTYTGTDPFQGTLTANLIYSGMYGATCSSPDLSESINIVLPNVLSSNGTVTNIVCNGESTGAINVEVTGGTAPYTYSWDSGETTQDLSDLAAGDYTITITDASGCTTTNTFTVTEPSNAISGSVSQVNNVTCFDDNDGSFTATASGGTSPYTYSIDNGTNTQSSGLFENLPADNYTVLITDSNGCTTTVDTVITQPDVLEVDITNVNNVNCTGEATGDITINVTGGTQPYTYSWNNSATSQNLTDVNAGSYTVTVTDASGCTASVSTTISEPASPLNLNISKVDANTAQGCANGEATANVTGGTAPYTYQWGASANNQTTASASNLPVGTHSVTVTDALGCQLTQSIVIICVNTCDAEISIDNITNVLCVGEATGSGVVSASSNANPSATFTFTWSNGQVDAGVTSSTLNNVTAGVYDVSVTIDGTVCQPVEETISITEPNNILDLTASSTDELGPNTGDGTASATATGGVEPYTYAWSPGGQTTQNITGLSAGTYTVTVTDANGCTDSVSVIVNPGTCNNLSISGSSTPVVCNGESNGSVTAVVSNGTGPFTYAWDTLSDTTPSVSNLPAGSYTVTVTDQTTLCTQSTTITVNEPNALSSGIAVTNILCKGDATGSVDLTVNGGTTPYTFLWDTGATTEDLINVVAGTYSVTITDANGCVTTNQSTVIEPDQEVSGTVTQVKNVDCSGESNGNITVEGSGGIPPYTYSINNGATSQSSGLFENLTAADYTILITDANGCTFSVDGTIGTDDTEDPTISVPATIVFEGCSTSDITSTNAVFVYSDTQSGDVQTVFASNSDYNADDDFNIQSITYIDVITSVDNCPLTISRTFTITDNCDNTATANQTITVQDTTAPTFTVPADLTIECDQDENDLTLTGDVTDEDDNCDTTLDATYSDSVAAGSCANESVITRTWSLTDDCNNTTTLVQTITVVDTTAPTFTVPADLTIECDQDENDLTLTGDVTDEDDNCDTTLDATYSDSVAAGSCANESVITRTWSLTDDCNNTTTLVQTITVVDTTAPTFTVPADLTIECDQDENDLTLTGDVTDEDDNCDTTLDATYSDSVAAGSCANESVITRTWSLTDDCNNTTTLVQTITVVDTTAPTFTVPADLTIECDQDENDLTLTGDVTDEDDNCDTTLDATYSDSVVAGSCANESVITRTWSLTDDCNNTTTLVQTITVVDTTAPTFTVPADLTIECDQDENDLTLTGDVTDEDDNCDTTLDATYSDSVTAGSCANESVITRTWSLTDDCNNTTTLVQTITVVDTTNPIITRAASDQTVQCDGNGNTTELQLWLDTNAGAEATDNCGDVTWTNNFTGLTTDCGNAGFALVTFTATDACGNTASTTALFTIRDLIAPTIDTPASDLTVECDGLGNTTDLNDWLATNGGAISSDICSNVTWSNDFTQLSDECGATGSALVTFTATDDCGNAVTTSATFTIVDTTAPTFTVPADLTIECDQDENDLTLTGDVTDENDNCDTTLDATYSDSVAAGSCANESVITRTWSLTDDCNNTTTLVQTITVVDTTTPTFTVPADLTIECDQDESDLTLTGDVTDENDNCDTTLDATYSDSVAAGSCANESVITRTWSLTDDCNNTTTLVQTITVVDTTAPTFTVPADLTIECDQDENDLTLTGDVTDENDNCDTTLDATYSDSVAAGSCANESVITRTWSLTDDCNNTTTLVQTITVVDTTAPTFTVPADLTIECDQDENDLTLTGDVTDENDNCDTTLDATYSDSVAAGSCANESVITRTWSLTDDCNNTTTLVQTITVVDTTAPTFTVPADLTIECDQDENDLTLTGDVTDEDDNCDTTLDATYSDSVAAGSCANESVITRTWSLTDDCNNTTTLVQTITVVDTTAPTFTVPADLTIECDQDENDLTLTGDVTDEDDNCDTTLDATYSDSVTAGSCANESVITRTWSLTDDCNNTTTLVQTITVVDTTAPIITLQATNIVVECDGNGNNGEIQNWLDTNGGATATDNCGAVTWTNNYNGATSDCSTPVEVIFTATDACGNSTTTAATYAIQDTTAPVVTNANDLTVECDGNGNLTAFNDWLNTNGGATATDDCSVITWSNDFTQLSDECGATGSALVTFTATDACGNATSTSATFTIVDTVAPAFNETLPIDVTVECSEVPTAEVLTASDDCSVANVTYNEVRTDGNCESNYTLTRSWLATDACGNETSHTQTITVQDTTAPTFTVPADLTIECDQDENDLTLTGDVADEDDNCDTTLDATYSDSVAAGSCANESVITRTWSLTDDCNNTTTLVQTITVVDTTAPTFTVPADLTIECDQDENDLTLTGDVTDEDDNCDTTLDATYSDSVAAGSCANESVITRTWSLTDDCNNTATLVQTITVVDTTAPTFTVPADLTIECDQDENDLTLTGDVTDEDDNCDTTLDATYSDSVAAGSCANESVITRTWSLTDDCNNTTTLVQTITVVDTTAPTFTVPADLTIECDQDENDLTLTGDVTDENDNCDTTLDATYADSVAAGSCANESVITRTWSLTDDCNNTTTLVQTITVVDTTAPTFTVPADLTIECDQDENDLTLTGDVADEDDNCDTTLDATYSDSVAAGSCANESVITRTWSLTDDCNNTTTLVQTITVVDTTAPTFTVPADLTIECDQDENDLTLTGDVTDENDNCDTTLDATYSDSVAAGSCANESVITRTWSLTDDCNNTTTLVQTITVVDTTAPTFTVPADLTIECDQDENDLTLTGDVTDENDNCDTTLDATYSDSVAAGSCANESVITRTWSLTDDCNNTTTLVQTITVVDTTAPTFTVPADLTIECDQDENDLTLTGDVTDEDDNCDTTLDATYSDSVAAGSCANESVITRTWSLTDDCNNTTTLVQTITVVDTTAPTFTVPADLTIECDQDENDLTLTGDVTDEDDNCDTTLDATYSDSVTAGSCANESVITRTWSLTDDCNNTTTLVQTITVVDTTAPIITLQATNIVVECDGNGNNGEIQNWLDTNGGATATDNCGAVTWTNNYNGATSDCSTPVEVIFTATDACGNSTTTAATYAIQDTTAPVVTNANDLTVECDGNGNLTAFNDWLNTNGGATATDDCSVITWSNDFTQLSDECGATGSALVTFTATDACGNATSTSATFTIVDTVAPAFNETLPIDVTVECSEVPTAEVLTASDDCSVANVTYNEVRTDGNCESNYTLTRSWLATDACGNETSHTQTITVQDTTAPTFTVPADLTIECDQDENDLTLTGDVADEDDNCDTTLDATYSDSVAAGSCANESVITRTWSLTDDCNNTTTLVQTITVVDTTAPTFTVPADLTIECDQDENDLTLTGDVTDEDDNCDTTLDATYSDSVAAGSCANESVITRTWSLTDDCNNTATLVQTITVVDTTAPTFTVPADLTIECDQDENDLTLTGDVTDEDDNCDTTLDATYSDSVAAGSCANESVITRTWSLTDDCNNTTTLVQTITVVDTTAPTFTVPADLTIECDQDENDLTLTGDVTDENDNCDTTLDATYADSVAAGSCANESVITRTWSLTDDCNNTTTLVQTITVVDTTAPTFTVPADLTIECDQDENDLTLTGDVADEDDNCDTTLDATYSDSVAAGSCANESVITRTWSLTDDCNNTTTLVQTITVVDTTAPTFTVPADLTIECDQDENDLTLTGDVTDEDDNCDTTLDATYSDSVAAGSCANESVITRTWSLTDDCNNTATLVQTITVVDTTAPTFTVPADLTIECDQDENDLTLTGDVTDEDDNCDTTLDATYSDSVAAGSCANESVITRTWSLTDDCNNTTTLVQTITVVDTTAPTFTVPADLTIECDQDENDLTLTGDVTDEDDNCDTTLDATYSDSVAAGSCANESVITRTWSLTDDCNNTTTLVQTITVVDTTAPTFTVPADLTIECDQDENDLTLTGDVTDEDDNCDTTLDATYSDSVAAGSCANESVITRTWSLTDDCNNTTTLVQTITVVDTTAPTFTVPADLTIECDQDENDLTLTGDVTDEDDNCDTTLDATYSDSVAAGSCANESVITRTWSLTDDCNNTTTLVQTITVVDTTAPTFTVPADLTIECDQDENDLTLTGDVTDEDDNCDTTLDATYSDSVAAGSCANESVITRTWSLTDDCNNTTTLVQTITVVDTTAPTFTVPADLTIECDQDENDLTLTGDVTDENDNCDTTLDATYADSVAAGSCANESVITRTWSLTDDCNNTTTLVQTITVVDTTAPTFTVPADLTIECDQDENDLTLTGDVADEDDNCDTTLDATYSDSVAAGSCANESVITRTWSLTDDCNNTTTLVQTITVVDTTAPTFTVPADLTIECDQDENDLTLTGDVTDEDDNCDTTLDATYSDSVAAGSCANESVITRTWSLTDDCSNTTTLVQTITVVDTTAPTFNEDLPEDVTVECDNIPNGDASTLTAADSCGNATVTFEEVITNGGCDNDFIIERTWTATDVCGNDTVHTQIITVQDTTAPALVSDLEENITVSCDDIPEVPELTFEDSCSANMDVVFDEDSTQANDFEDYEIIRTWTVTDDCGNEAVFVQTITVEISNVINAFDSTRCIEDIEFDLFDLLSGDFDTNGTWSVISGNATINGSLFDPSSVELGLYTFQYAITEGPCPKEVEVNVTIDDDCVVLACGEDDVVISKTVTANGDMYNEYFTVSGIEDCGFVIELEIFNRWGAKIYESKNYQNDWNGNAHGSSVGSSGKVPTGTYYYVINLRNSGLEPFAGPIYVATK